MGGPGPAGVEFYPSLLCVLLCASVSQAKRVVNTVRRGGGTLKSAALVLAGAWAIEEQYAAAALARMEQAALAEIVQEGWSRSGEEDGPRYEVTDGVARLSLDGPMTKKPTCMAWMLGGVSTVEARRALRQAVEDAGVRAIVLCIDSPGGEVAGTFDLADEVARAAAIKPVTAYLEDLCCSAAYAVASQASRVVANRSAVVGAIGTYMVIPDSSRAAQNAGVNVHVVRAGRLKGAGSPGSEVTGEHLAEFQRTVDGLNAQFIATVAQGRGMSVEDVAMLADGRVWVGADAIEVGLVDAVGSLDEVMRGPLAKAQRRKGGVSNLLDGPLAQEARGREGLTMSLKQAWQAFVAGFHAGERGQELHDSDALRGEADLASVLQAEEAGTTPPHADGRGMDGQSAFCAVDNAQPPAPTAVVEPMDDALAAIRRQLAEAEAAKQTEHSARLDGLLSNMKRDGLLTPAASDTARRLLATDEAAFTAFVAKQGRLLAFARPEDLPRSGEPNGAQIAAELQSGEQPFAVLQRVTEQILKAKDVPYHIAFSEACRQRPDLAAAHVEGMRL